MHSEEAAIPGANVFRKDGALNWHFHSIEMTEGDPGQHPRNPLEPDPLWQFLEVRPWGRRPD